MCFPFLAVNESFTVGPWRVMSLNEALRSETWRSDQFKADVVKMLGLFRYGPYGASVENPTVLSRISDGMTGEPPAEHHERNALTATISFCALDTNRPRSSGMIFDWIVAEHLDYWEFPVSDDGFVALPTGRRFRTLHAASWSEEQSILGPTVLASIPHVRVNPVTASVLYKALMHTSDDSRRLRTAITFLVESWRNHSSVVGLSDWQFEPGAIICDQQTAFEALLDIKGTRQDPAKDQIVQKFQELIDQLKAIDPVVEQCSDCLWGEHTLEQLEEWASTFTQRRNKTIHEGDVLAGLPETDDPANLLREVVDIADLVLRDAIRAKAVLISELPPGEALQNALASPSNSDYMLMIAVAEAWATLAAANEDE